MSKDNKNFLSKNLETEAGFNLSWGSVFAGVITFLAVFLLLSLITSAIGLGGFDPTESHPMNGVGTGMAIWIVVSLLLSLFAGGFVAGLAARKTGMLHGFLTWALSLILVFWLIASTAVGAVSSLGSAIGSITGAITDEETVVADNSSEDILSQIGMKIEDVDVEAISEKTKSVLKDTGTKELQPEYLNEQLEEAKDEIAAAGKEIVVNPGNADQIIDDLTDSLQQRIDHIGTNVDRDAVKNAVAENTELTDAEADEAVDNAISEFETAKTEASQKIEEAKVAVEDAKVEIDQTVEEGKVKADDATDTASGATIILFVGLLLGAILTSFAGIVGSKYTRETVIQE